MFASTTQCMFAMRVAHIARRCAALNYDVVDSTRARLTISIGNLCRANVCVPHVQRILDEDRVQAIVAFQRRRISETRSALFIGDLILGVDVASEQEWLLDGQHRHAAMSRLSTELADYPVTVTLLALTPTLGVSTAFELINRAVPVPVYVVETTTHAARRDLLERFRLSFESSEFAGYVSKASHPRRPNINITQFLDRFVRLGGRILDATESATDLMAFVRWANHRILNGLSESDVVLSRALIKKKGDPFVITADVDDMWLRNPEWWDEYVASGRRSWQTRTFEGGEECHEIKRRGTSIDRITTKYKKKKNGGVPTALRMALWNAHFGERVGSGSCRCCGRDITQQSFHAGHVVSVFNGGETTLQNLVPLCASCNLSMGATNFDDFAPAFSRLPAPTPDDVGPAST